MSVTAVRRLWDRSTIRVLERLQKNSDEKSGRSSEGTSEVAAEKRECAGRSE
jgi:hypothetical protein